MEAILGELAELGLAMARDLAMRVRESEDVAETDRLVAAFHKTSRAVRLTLALDLKLERDAARAAREAAREARAEAEAAERRESPAALAAQAALRALHDPAPAERQKDRVRRVMNRLLWTESEGDQEEYEVLLEDLDARLCEAAEAPGFEDMPLEALAHRLKADMQLSGDLVVTTAEAMIPANAAQPALADTG